MQKRGELDSRLNSKWRRRTFTRRRSQTRWDECASKTHDPKLPILVSGKANLQTELAGTFATTAVIINFFWCHRAL